MLHSFKGQLKFAEVKTFEEVDFIQVSSQNYIAEPQWWIHSLNSVQMSPEDR